MPRLSIRDMFLLTLVVLQLGAFSARSFAVEPRLSEGLQAKYSESARDGLLAQLIPSRKDLRHHLDPTLAILSRWHDLDPGNIGELREFLGYVSGRLRCELPHFWQRRLIIAASARVEKGGDWQSKAMEGLQRNDSPDPVFKGQVHKVGEFVLGANRGLKVDSGSTFFRIHAAHAAVELDYEWVSARQQQNYASILETADHKQIAVAMTDNLAAPFRIALFASADSKLVWEREVWSLGEPLRARVNSPDHLLEIMETDSSFVMLGVCGHCYLEEFDRTSGTCKCRFASNFWKRDR